MFLWLTVWCEYECKYLLAVCWAVSMMCVVMLTPGLHTQTQLTDQITGAVLNRIFI